MLAHLRRRSHAESIRDSQTFNRFSTFHHIDCMIDAPLRHGCRNLPPSHSQYMLFTPQKCNGKNTRSPYTLVSLPLHPMATQEQIETHNTTSNITRHQYHAVIGSSSSTHHSEHEFQCSRQTRESITPLCHSTSGIPKTHTYQQ